MRRLRSERGGISSGWLILGAGIVSFVLAMLFRSFIKVQPQGLEGLILANAPEEHVHAVVYGTEGRLFVGTHLGLFSGSDERHLSRMDPLRGDVTNVMPTGANEAYAVVANVGLVQITDGRLVATLRSGQVEAAAIDAANSKRIVLFRTGSGLEQTVDGGTSWVQLTTPSQHPLAIALGPRNSDLIVLGQLSGGVAVSKDGGKTWSAVEPLVGGVSALLFDRNQPDRLWAAAGGEVYQTDSLGANWTKVSVALNQAIVSIAYKPTALGPVGVTPEGAIISLGR